MADDPIHLLHVTPTLSRLGGGVAAYLWSFVQAGLKVGLMPTVAGLDDPFACQDITVQADVELFLAKRVGPRSVGFSPALRRFLDQQLDRVDVVHAHGLRMMPSYEARRCAVGRRVPLVISPHGQLDPWIMAYGVLRKRLIGLLFEDRNLQTAACIHATAYQEARHIRACDLPNPIAVVPIGLDVQSYTTTAFDTQIVDRWPGLAGKKRLLFLSTIYRKKGLARLAQVWGRLHRDWPDWHLVVTGIDLHQEQAKAESIIAACDAKASTTFTGPVTDPVKRQLLAASDLYVLPTDGENFGISVAEALASGLPVITSNTTPWRDLEQFECGWWINVGVEPLYRALSQAMGLPDRQRCQMGQRGRQLIEQKYAWGTIAGQMRHVYAWLLGHEAKPAFVYTTGEPIPD